MFKLKIDPNDKTRVVIETTPDYPVETFSIPFSFKCEDEFNAKLMLHNIANKLDNLVLDIKKDCYEKGFADGRKKKAKRTWIHSIFLRKDLI